MKRLVFLVGLLLISCRPVSNPTADNSPRFYAIDLPRGTVEARLGAREIPMLFLTLRVTTDAGRKQVLYSEEDETLQIPLGEAATTSFTATSPFKSIGAFLATDGKTDSRASLTLKDETGKTVATRTNIALEDRVWIDLAFPNSQTGKYIFEIRNEAGTVGWRGKRIKSPFAAAKDAAGLTAGNVPFQIKSIPQFTNSTLKIPLGTTVDELYLLGGTSTYDQGAGWWNDSEAQKDYSEKQFIGDKAGDVRILYTDNTTETVPILFGWNIWWFNPYDNPLDGGPYGEPFASNASAAEALRTSFRLTPVQVDPIARYFWRYKPKPVAISAIEFLDNPEKRGFPIVSAVTVKTAAALQGFQALNVAPPPATPPSVPADDPVPAIVPADVKTKAYEGPLESLRRVLYTYDRDFASLKPADPAVAPNMLTFQGPVTATILTRVFSDNLDSMLRKMEDGGNFHTSGEGSPNYGGYVGIGTWRPYFGLFYNQSWSRDMGRALLEALSFGQLPKAEMGIKFADSHLYDLPDGFPRINRDGEKVPAHWATVLQDPLYMDIDHKGDGNQENDGHGLLLLAHYRAWEQKGRDSTWLKDRWSFIADATDWYVFQMDNPYFSRFDGVLYSESEAANEKGYDVYSNFIALKALEKSVIMGGTLGDNARVDRWKTAARQLRQGILENLTVVDPRFGKTWKATAWNWTYANESLAPAIILADTDGYSLADSDPEFLAITRNTLAHQIALTGATGAPRILGYGQGFLAQAALLLDDVEAYSSALDHLAKYIYSDRANSYLVPEGVIADPAGKYWYRNGDLGNAAQQAEVLKVLALVAGIDNNTPNTLRLMPRLPLGWNGISVKDYALPSVQSSLSYELMRSEHEIRLRFSTPSKVPAVQVRLGPVPKDGAPILTVDGRKLQPSKIETIGDWQWVWMPELEDVSAGETMVAW